MTQRERKIFRFPVDSLTGWNSKGWARSKPGTPTWESGAPGPGPSASVAFSGTGAGAVSEAEQPGEGDAGVTGSGLWLNP